MALMHKDWLQYHEVYKNDEGRQLICPRCGGGNGASEKARKKKLKPIKDRFCFTCWGTERKRIHTLAKVPPKTPEVSLPIKPLARWQRKGRNATIRRAK